MSASQAPAAAAPVRYHVVRQTIDDLRSPESAPALSMGAYLVATGQEALLNSLSVYSERGQTPAAARLLYMNTLALELWQAMGRQPALDGLRHRPPRTALLAFGVPFSE